MFRNLVENGMKWHKIAKVQFERDAAREKIIRRSATNSSSKFQFGLERLGVLKAREISTLEN